MLRSSFSFSGAFGRQLGPLRAPVAPFFCSRRCSFQKQLAFAQDEKKKCVWFDLGDACGFNGGSSLLERNAHLYKQAFARQGTLCPMAFGRGSISRLNMG